MRGSLNVRGGDAEFYSTRLMTNEASIRSDGIMAVVAKVCSRPKSKH